MKMVLRVLGLVSIGAAAMWFSTFGSFEQEIRYSVAADFPMPDFRLPLLDEGLMRGDTAFVELADLQGKVLLVAFWATWCSPCIAEQPSYLSLEREFGNEGFELLGILHRDRESPALAWLTENERTEFTTLVGTDALARTIRVGGLPHTLLVDRRGQVVERFLGWWPEREEYLRGRIRALLDA